MTQLQKIIIGVNLLILLAYTVSCYTPKVQHLAFVAHAMMIGYHLLGLLFLGILAHVSKKEDMAKAFGLSMGVVLLVGLGTCVIYG
jgi:hypothetical protein